MGSLFGRKSQKGTKPDNSNDNELEERYNKQIKKVKEMNNKFAVLYSQFEETIFLKNITLVQYNELLFQFNNQNERMTKENCFNINNKNECFSIINKVQYQEFITQLIEKANPPVQNKNECIHFLSVIYEHLSQYDSKNNSKDGLYKISLIPLGLLFCKATQFEKLKFFYDFYKVEELLLIDSYIYYALKLLVYISTYSLSYFVCEKNQFDFTEIKEDTINDSDEKREEKSYISFFASATKRNKLLDIAAYLFCGYSFDEISKLNEQNFNLNDLSYSWDKFLDIHKAKKNEFWAFSSFLIRDFMFSHYNKQGI